MIRRTAAAAHALALLAAGCSDDSAVTTSTAAPTTTASPTTTAAPTTGQPATTTTKTVAPTSTVPPTTFPTFDRSACKLPEPAFRGVGLGWPRPADPSPPTRATRHASRRP